MNAEPHYDYTQTVLPKPLLKRFAKQIAMGIFCSCIATVIVNFAGVKRWVLHVCSAVTYLGGNTITGEGGVIPKIKEKVGDFEAKIPKVGHIPAHMPSLHKTPEQLETEAKLKEEKEKRQNESSRRIAIAELESMGVEFDREATLEKLLVVLNEEKEKRQNESKRKVVIAELESMGGQFDREASLDELLVARKDAKEMQRKRPLLDHADKIGLHVDPNEPYDVLKGRIKEAELDADYQEQVRLYERNMEFRQKIIDTYNARCPNPKCRRVCRVTQKTGNVRCPKCGLMATAGRFRGNWTMPPFPPQPKRKTGVMDRVKGLFGK